MKFSYKGKQTKGQLNHNALNKLPLYRLEKLYNEVKDNHTQRMLNNTSNVPPPFPATIDETTGTGFRRRRKIYGKGTPLSWGNPKLAVNLKKLNKNVLSVNYVSSKLTKMNPIAVSDDVKNIVIEIITQKKLNAEQFDKLTPKEKRVVEVFVHSLGIQSEMEMDNINCMELFKDYEILKGEIQAGNNNKWLKQKLREVILEIQYINHLTKKQTETLLATYRV
jgi:hypothetical protein